MIKSSIKIPKTKILNPATGRLVSVTGTIGKSLIALQKKQKHNKAARIIQRAYKKYAYHNFMEFKGSYDQWLNHIHNKVNLRFAKTVADHFQSLPTITELRYIAKTKDLNKNYFDINSFKNHFGVNKLIL